MFTATSEQTEFSSFQWEQLCCRFSLADIQSATQNFDDSLVIGRGGFGKVYKAPINNGTGTAMAAIKRLDSRSNQGAPEFWAEIDMLSKLRHCHLVSLLGYCDDDQEMLLVYEYMPHGTLDDHLHKLKNDTPLSWLQRLKICIGAARGLDYLHTGTGTLHGVIHRDVKSSNILLDGNWAAKISDFGLSKIGPTNQPRTCVSTAVKGTFGYVDPDYFSSGRLTRKSDVYAFGVVLFEVLCGRRAVDTSLDEEQWGLARWAQDCVKEGKLKQIIDPSLRGQILPKCLKGFAQIAVRCLHSHPKQRPTMAEVVAKLEFALSLQETSDYSIQPVGITMFTKKVQQYFFASSVENSVHGDGKPSRKNISNNFVLPKRDLLLSKDGDVIQEVSPSGPFATPNLKVFTFAELRSATRKFSQDRLLGEGRFGQVFLGWVDENTCGPLKAGSKMAIAVKKLSEDSIIEGSEQWQSEVNFLGRLSHPNLVKLLGYCWEDKDLLLVYEFMQKGSLGNHLFRLSSAFEPLSWDIRLKIAIGAARGLAFLHSSKERVIYRDFKASHILLDGNYNAKLADFGLAKNGPEGGLSHVTTRVMGTCGYAAPEYVATGHLSVKSDVYGFGAVLLEMLTGLRAFDEKRPSAQHNLVDWARLLLCHKRKLKSIMDPRIEGQYSPRAALQAAHLTLKCLENEPKKRPSMKEVVEVLEQIYGLKEKPKN